MTKFKKVFTVEDTTAPALGGGMGRRIWKSMILT